MSKSENKIKLGGHGPFKGVRDQFFKMAEKNLKYEKKTEKLQNKIFNVHFLDKIWILQKHLLLSCITMVFFCKNIFYLRKFGGKIGRKRCLKPNFIYFLS